MQIDEEGNIYIDGEILEEDYGAEVISNPGRAAEPVQLGEDEYFVMGDNSEQQQGQPDGRGRQYPQRRYCGTRMGENLASG